MATVSRQRLRSVVEPVVTAAGYDLEDLSVSPAGRRSLVRVVVDRDGGVDLDGVAELSRTISAALDSDDVGEAPYTLEVGSPGVDRPLAEPRHWRRSVGRLVRVPLRAGGELTGRVHAADDAAVTIEVGGERRTIGYDELGTGKVQVEFERRAAATDGGRGEDE